MPSWLVKLRSRGLVAQTAVVLAAVLLAYALAAPIAWLLDGTVGLTASAIAAGLCMAGAIVALVICHATRHSDQAWLGVMAGMLPRMGIPLGCALFFQLRGGPLVEAGLLYYLVPFYLVALGVETMITLPGGNPSGSTVKPSETTARPSGASVQVSRDASA